ncbi:hypothetical protein [Mollivirus kamchatka]|nr:hypothetical protein [Mollivirus kamchatka]
MAQWCGWRQQRRRHLLGLAFSDQSTDCPSHSISRFGGGPWPNGADGWLVRGATTSRLGLLAFSGPSVHPFICASVPLCLHAKVWWWWSTVRCGRRRGQLLGLGLVRPSLSRFGAGPTVHGRKVGWRRQQLGLASWPSLVHLKVWWWWWFNCTVGDNDSNLAWPWPSLPHPSVPPSLARFGGPTVRSVGDDNFLVWPGFLAFSGPSQDSVVVVVQLHGRRQRQQLGLALAFFFAPSVRPSLPPKIWWWWWPNGAVGWRRQLLGLPWPSLPHPSVPPSQDLVAQLHGQRQRQQLGLAFFASSVRPSLPPKIW